MATSAGSVEAEQNLKDALTARESLAKDEPQNVRSRLDVGWTHLALGTVHWKAVRLDLADREWTTGLRGMEAAIRGEPEDSALWNELTNAWIQVADKLLQLGLWEKADELFDHAFKRKPASLVINNGHYWYVHAMLRAPRGDTAGFRTVCTEFFNQFKNNDSKFNLYRACWSGPSALSDMKVLVPMVDADLARHRTDPWFILHAAMIHTRAGRSRRRRWRSSRAHLPTRGIIPPTRRCWR